MSDSLLKTVRPGIGNASSYQSSGHPWITGSTISTGNQNTHSLPFVSKRVKIQVIESGKHVDVHFNDSGSGNVLGGKHFWRVHHGEPLDADIRCKELYITTTGSNVQYQVMAVLTTIQPSEMFNLTGSGLTD